MPDITKHETASGRNPDATPPFRVVQSIRLVSQHAYLRSQSMYPGSMTRAKSVFVILSYCTVAICLLTGGTVIPVSAVVPTVLEKSTFYGYLTVPSVSHA